ncbi:M66 family metalloprotease [Kocuria sabuli]|uniref:M66 family metalloprotease n=1 Tax=Kocuria sabuli TaxID=3071448 RepID=UPI0034D63AA0
MVNFNSQAQQFSLDLANVVNNLGLSIQGIEVTQCVQYYEADDHLTDSADRGENNSIRLVSGKPAWVRVYLWSAFETPLQSGTLEVQRRSHGILWNTVTTLSPDPSSATSIPALPQYDATRGDLSRTLNFIIPADEMIGQLRLVARAESKNRTAQGMVDIAVTLRQTLRIAGVMIAYNGPASNAPNAPNLTIAAPTLADLQAISVTALTMFPVQTTAIYRAASTLTQSQSLMVGSFPTSGCGAPWDILHARVANVRVGDGNPPGWIYYGLLPNGVPTDFIGGCGGGGVAVGPPDAGTFAHEVGHACGLGHAPDGIAPNPDPSYPAYEPYDPVDTPRASTGEFGLDINNGRIFTPRFFRDFMSYSVPDWISPYHYTRLLDNATLDPVTVGIDYPWWKDLVWEEVRKWPEIPEMHDELELPVFPPSRRVNIISLIARIDFGEITEVLHVIRANAYVHQPRTSGTPFIVRLRDQNGQVLSVGSLTQLRSNLSCNCGIDEKATSYVAQALLPDTAPGSTLEIYDGDTIVWSRSAPNSPPQVGDTHVDVDETGVANISWEMREGSAEPLQLWLRWSRDGEVWRSVLTELSSPPIEISVDQLPQGEGLLQIVAHDGFFSSYGEPVSLTIPDRPARGVILHPVQDHTYVAGQTIRLWASIIDDADDGTENAVWSVDGTVVGQGVDTWTVLEAGRRTVAFRVGPNGVESAITINVNT